jgi:hypothetical protein
VTESCASIACNLRPEIKVFVRSLADESASQQMSAMGWFLPVVTISPVAAYRMTQAEKKR